MDFKKSSFKNKIKPAELANTLKEHVGDFKTNVSDTAARKASDAIRKELGIKSYEKISGAKAVEFAEKFGNRFGGYTSHTKTTALKKTLRNPQPKPTGNLISGQAGGTGAPIAVPQRKGFLNRILGRKTTPDTTSVSKISGIGARLNNTNTPPTQQPPTPPTLSR